MKQYPNKKLLFGGIAVISIFLVAGILLSDNDAPPDYEFPPPVDVVRQYFTAWRQRDYPNMYATISDGFKKIEPTAQDLRKFKEYVESQTISGVTIMHIEEKTNNGGTATVYYEVDFSLADGSIRPFQGTFTLKNRDADVVRGWKLIHPYGENVDTS